MNLRRLLRDLVGRGDAELIAILVAQVDVAADALRVLTEQLTVGTPDQLAQRMDELESAGDQRRRDLAAHLSRALTTPIDREDLFRVSRSIDDVLDNLRDFARELVLFEPERTDCFVPLVEAGIDGVSALGDAIQALAGDRDAAHAANMRTKRGGNEIRRRYDQELAALFDGELTMDVVKTRELLRRLDVVALRLAEAADALDDGLLKRM